MTKRKSDFTLPTLDDLFTTQEMRDDAKLERIQELPLAELHPFEDHPFKVLDNEEMEKIVESIRKFGVLTPGLARPIEGGGYELISGHRRLAACQKLGIEKMPVIVREMDDDEAVIAMVDANLQRETILPSEKAFAYKMKMDALKHQGLRADLTSSQLGTKLRADEEVAQASGDSRNQVQRYIRLTYLHPDLLIKVDEGKIAFNPAVELSFLTIEEQATLLDAMAQNDCTPSHAQAIRLKKMSQDGMLTDNDIYDILAEEKANQKEKLKIPTDRIRKYFPASYTTKQMEETVVKLCEAYYRKRNRDRDSR